MEYLYKLVNLLNQYDGNDRKVLLNYICLFDYLFISS